VGVKKTRYGLKAFGVGHYVKEIVFEAQIVPNSNWTVQRDTVVENWTKKNPSSNTWNNGTN